jgi:hypothetical protein
MEIPDQTAQADKDLARRAIHGTWAFPLLVLALYLATSFPKDHPRMLCAVGAATGLLGTGRLALLIYMRRLYSANPRLWRLLFLGSAITNAGCWGIFLGVTIHLSGLAGRPNLLLLFSVLGSCTISLSAFAPYPTALRCYVIAMMLPSIVAEWAMGSIDSYFLACVLVLDSDLSAEQREDLDMVSTSAHSLMRLLNEILDFSKIEAGKLEMEEIEFQLPDLFQDSLRMFAMEARRKKLELLCELSADLPDKVIGDPGRLRQILMNLVGNALKFTERGSVTLRARVAGEPDDGVELEVEVADTGIGIPAEKQRLIFNAFSQADESTTRKYGGTGLGLAISARLVDMLGGRIWVDSQPGSGARFHFTGRYALPQSKRVEIFI